MHCVSSLLLIELYLREKQHAEQYVTPFDGDTWALFEN
jgi:hypothetical protein